MMNLKRPLNDIHKIAKKMNLSLFVSLLLLLQLAPGQSQGQGQGQGIPPFVAEANEMVFFTLDYGFSDNEREPTQTEIEELLCITNVYIQTITENYTTTELDDTTPIQAFATNIHWNYSPGESLSTKITFTADVTYAVSTEQERVPKSVVMQAFGLSIEQIGQYITDWVWQVEQDNVFYNTVRVQYNVKQNQNLDTDNTRLPEVTNCGITRMPTVAPLTTTQGPTTPSSPVTASPTVSPAPSGSQAPTLSPAPSVSPAPSLVQTIDPQDTQDMVYFQMNVLLDDQGMMDMDDDWTPSLQDVQALLCKTNAFFQDQVQEQQATTPADEETVIVSSEVSNIEWISSGTADAGSMTFFFTFYATYAATADPVSLEMVAQAVDGKNQELLQYILLLQEEEEEPTTRRRRRRLPVHLPGGILGRPGFGGDDDQQQGTNLRNTNANNPLIQATTNVTTLQALPLGTPVRVGKLQVAECPEEPPTSSDDSQDEDDATRGENSLLLNAGLVSHHNEATNNNNEEEDPSTNSTDGDSDNNTAGNNSINHSGAVYPPRTSIIIPVTIDFLVSNLEGWQEPDAILKEGGLAQSWPILVQDLVHSLGRSRTSMPPPTPNNNLRRKRTRRSLLQQQEHKVDYVPNSAQVVTAFQTPCGPWVHPDSICHQVQAEYGLFLLLDDNNEPSTALEAAPASNKNSVVQDDDDDDDDSSATKNEHAEIKRVYQVETYKAINDGTYYSVLKRQVPDTPLYIGTVPLSKDHQGNDDDEDTKGGLENWDWLVIVLLAIIGVLCCTICLAVGLRFWARDRPEKTEEEKEEKVYLRETDQTEIMLHSSHTHHHYPPPPKKQPSSLLEKSECKFSPSDPHHDTEEDSLSRASPTDVLEFTETEYEREHTRRRDDDDDDQLEEVWEDDDGDETTELEANSKAQGKRRQRAPAA